MVSRRDFLKATIASAAALSLDQSFARSMPDYGGDFLQGRRLWPNFQSFNHLWLARNKDSFKLDVSNINHYKAACWILRDWRENECKAASLWLLRTVSLVQAIITEIHRHEPLYVHSGYRTERTNTKVGGVEHSMHLADERGMFYAMDVSSRSLSVDVLGRIALHAKQGGVGIYRGKGFVHIDVGIPRTWSE